MTWTHVVADAALDDLSAGEVLTQSYDVTVDDGNGGTAVATVTITITGSNDAPVIEAADTSGWVIELADGSALENNTTISNSGLIGFSDVDLADGHTVSVSANGEDYRGAMTAVVSDAATGDTPLERSWRRSSARPTTRASASPSS